MGDLLDGVVMPAVGIGGGEGADSNSSNSSSSQPDEIGPGLDGGSPSRGMSRRDGFDAATAVAAETTDEDELLTFVTAAAEDVGDFVGGGPKMLTKSSSGLLFGAAAAGAEGETDPKERLLAPEASRFSTAPWTSPLEAWRAFKLAAESLNPISWRDLCCEA